MCNNHTCYLGSNENWHGHVTAVTCAPSHRRLGLAGRLMDALEKISEQKDCWFVDLFVRVSNTVAITMYKVCCSPYNILGLFWTREIKS